MQVLHQPLTLLDCLHTFCGFCLKEWFVSQASRASSSNPNPFSCPSCRASVRDTRPDAKVTTLLDMYIKVNPGRARDEKEKDEIRSKYTPGENVMPRIRRERESSDQIEDRRIVEEVRELSLREVGIREESSHERGNRRRARDRSRDERNGVSRQRRRDREEEPSGSGGHDEETARPSTATDAANQARRVGHQSSLRSLLSTSDLDSSEMEEEILRQIMDEGILDGIDLNSIDAGQEDELSEKIAEAYRRRHGRMSRSQNDRTSQQSATSPRGQRSDSNEPRQRRPGRSPNPVDQTTHYSHPPVSRPHLLEAYPTGEGHNRRTSSETRQMRRQTSPTPTSSSSRRASETQRQAARSATDLSNRPQSSNPASRSATDLSARPQTSQNQRIRARDIPSGVRRTTDPANTVTSASRVSSLDPPRVAGQTHQQVSRHTDTPRFAARAPSEPHAAADVSASQPLEPPAPPIPQVTFQEPSISCERCGTVNLEHELHMNCHQCLEGRYNLCLRCWRLGRGCLHWYGFGRKAMIQWEKKAVSGAGYPPEHSLPHRLTGNRYLHPPSDSCQPRSEVEQRLMTTSEPRKRLQSGPFCSNCAAFSPKCFWECEICNDGEWGYCNPCVNQGKCCTHPLLPASYPLSTNPLDSGPSNATSHVSSTTFTPIASSQPQTSEEPADESRIPLTFSTKCDICTYPIPPSTTRFHCPQCNDGDYDICTTCYLRLVKIGRISAENGPKGWRRCPNGHRMIVIGFEDSVQGQRRIVVEDLVGGHALDNNTGSEDRVWRWGDQSQQAQTGSMTAAVNSRSFNGSTSHPNNLATGNYPPSGGVGMRVLAYWSYWPQDGVEDELAFPKNAEIRECEDINGDWFLGVYCGRKGVFPGNYCRVLEKLGR